MTLKIMPHGRLQEWVAHEEGYFTGLDYDFVPDGDYGIRPDGRDDSGEIRTGAFETFGAGRSGANVSCACHWATNAAASEGAGKLVTSAYSVAPCAIVVPADSPIRRPEDLAGVPVGVGYHSGSHFTTVQALESVLAPDDVALTFQGPPNERLDALLDGRVPAATMFGVPLYMAQSFGFRTVVDATFMVGFLVTGDEVSAEDIDKYLAGLRRAQMAIDLHPSGTNTITSMRYRRSTATGWTCARSVSVSGSSSCPTRRTSSPPPGPGPPSTACSRRSPRRSPATTRWPCADSASVVRGRVHNRRHACIGDRGGLGHAHSGSPGFGRSGGVHFNTIEDNTFTRAGRLSFYRDEFCDTQCARDNELERQCASYHNRFFDNRLVSDYDGDNSSGTWTLSPPGLTYAGAAPCAVPAGDVRLRTGGNTAG